jgi:hypothetical protein
MFEAELADQNQKQNFIQELQNQNVMLTVQIQEMQE